MEDAGRLNSKEIFEDDSGVQEMSSIISDEEMREYFDLNESNNNQDLNCQSCWKNITS